MKKRVSLKSTTDINRQKNLIEYWISLILFRINFVGRFKDEIQKKKKTPKYYLCEKTNDMIALFNLRTDLMEFVEQSIIEFHLPKKYIFSSLFSLIDISEYIHCKLQFCPARFPKRNSFPNYSFFALELYFFFIYIPSVEKKFLNPKKSISSCDKKFSIFFKWNLC